MTPSELKEAHQKLGLTSQQAAKAFGLKDGRAVRRWWTGHRPAPDRIIQETKDMLERQATARKGL